MVTFSRDMSPHTWSSHNRDSQHPVLGAENQVAGVGREGPPEVVSWSVDGRAPPVSSLVVTLSAHAPGVSLSSHKDTSQIESGPYCMSSWNLSTSGKVLFMKLLYFNLINDRRTYSSFQRETSVVRQSSMTPRSPPSPPRLPSRIPVCSQSQESLMLSLSLPFYLILCFPPICYDPLSCL